MNVSTQDYIKELFKLKPGDLGLLRSHAGQGLDESVPGFDLFAGIWWPLRQKNQLAPRREVSWLIAKLYATCPLDQKDGEHIASLLGRFWPNDEKEQKRYRQRFDKLLRTPLRKLEPNLFWALSVIGVHNGSIDWITLTDDLSIWERISKRREWAKRFTNMKIGDNNAD